MIWVKWGPATENVCHFLMPLLQLHHFTGHWNEVKRENSSRTSLATLWTKYTLCDFYVPHGALLSIWWSQRSAIGVTPLWSLHAALVSRVVRSPQSWHFLYECGACYGDELVRTMMEASLTSILAIKVVIAEKIIGEWTEGSSMEFLSFFCGCHAFES